MEQERVKDLADEAVKLFRWQKTTGHRISMKEAVIRILERHYVSTSDKEGQPRKLILSELGGRGGRETARKTARAAKIERMEDEAASIRVPQSPF